MSNILQESNTMEDFKETLIPSGLRYRDHRIDSVIEDIEGYQKAIDAIKWDGGNGMDSVGMLKSFQKSGLKKKEELKNLLNVQEDRRLLLAEMTLMMKTVVDNSKGLEYGDDFEEHF